MRYKESKARPRRTPRVTVPLTHHFTERLVGYAAVAGAAGVGLLAAVTPASADIVYTPAGTQILPGFNSVNLVPLDLNHDGITDFVFVDGSYPIFGVGTLGIGGAGDGGFLTYRGRAARLNAGAIIGASKQIFLSYSGNMVRRSIGGYVGGYWLGATNKYLGLTLFIKDQYYFGWARLSVRKDGTLGAAALLTGYAYDTVAGQQILAGQTSSTPEPGTLGLLALGSLTLGTWRRKKQESEVRN